MKLQISTMVVGMGLVAGLGAGQARAENIEVDSAITDRLAQQGQLARIYRDTFKKDMPAGTTASATLQGTMTSPGMVFQMKNAYPANPLVLQQQTMNNCNKQPVTQNASVNKTTTNTQSWTDTDTLSVGVSATVGYSSPLGPTIEGTVTTDYSTEHAETKEMSESVQWTMGADVPVDPGQQVYMQFVVEEAKQDVPYTVSFVAAGKTGVTFTPPGTPRFSWAEVKDGKIPANAIAGGKDKDGKTYWLCQAEHDKTTQPGKVVNGKCNFGYYGDEIRKEKFKVLVGDASLARWKAETNPKNTEAFVGGKEPGKTLRVCQADYKGSVHPGKVVSGRCKFGFGGKEEDVKSWRILIEDVPQAQTASVNLEQYLPSTADRTFTVNGVYKDVTGVQGLFQVSAPTAANCTMMASTTTTSSSTKSLKASTPTVSNQAAPAGTPFTTVTVVQPTKARK